jgi:putative hydrolase of the HAD superfamily
LQGLAQGRLINLKPAREIGMTRIKVHNAKQALHELEAATGLLLQVGS